MANVSMYRCLAEVPLGASLLPCDALSAAGTGSGALPNVNIDATIGEMMGSKENPQAGTWAGPMRVARALVGGVGHYPSGPGVLAKQPEVGQDLMFIITGQTRVESGLPTGVGNGAGGQVDPVSQNSASLLGAPVPASSAVAFAPASDGQHGMAPLACGGVLPIDIMTVNSEPGWGDGELVLDALLQTGGFGPAAGGAGEQVDLIQDLLQIQPGRSCPADASSSRPYTSAPVTQYADATPTAVNAGQGQSESRSPCANPQPKLKFWQLGKQTDPYLEAKRVRAKKAREQRERFAEKISNKRQEVADVERQVEALREEKITLVSKISTMEVLMQMLGTKEPIRNKRASTSV